MADKGPKPELWLKFLEYKFGPQGGRTMVPNTNRESRERYPKVEVFTLLRTDDAFRRKTVSEYKRWRKTVDPQDSKKKDEKSPLRVKTQIEVPKGLHGIHDLIRDAGHELYLVGGAVRDHVLGKNPKDFDLATDAPPQKIIDVLSKDSRYKDKLDLTGQQFGVVRVRDPQGEEYEIATFREDIGEGRRPDEVRFTTIEEDVTRRDLTINALFYDLDTNEVVDYVGGLEDAKKGVIRTVGNPEDRFREDKLRVLRVVRFAGRLGADIDPKTFEAIKKDPDLHEVSPERVRDEFVRGIASAKDPKHYLKTIDELGLYDQVFPGLEINKSYPDTPDPVIQIASLLRENKPKDIEKVMREMKYSRDEIQKVLFLLKMRELSPEQAYDLKKIFKKLKMETPEMMAASKALGKPERPKVEAFVNFAKAPPALTGKELAERGVPKGPEMGRAIAKAEQQAYEAFLGH